MSINALKKEVERLKAEVSALRKAAQDYVDAESGGFIAPAAECAREFRKVLNADSKHGLPGTDTCSNQWHRLKCVGVPNCPDCQMSTVEFNIALAVARA